MATKKAKKEKVVRVRVFKTRYPLKFSGFFMNTNYKEFEEKLELFEKCHGYVEEIEFEFFQKAENGNENCLVKRDSLSFSGAENITFSDESFSKECVLRKCLILEKKK